MTKANISKELKFLHKRLRQFLIELVIATILGIMLASIFG